MAKINIKGVIVSNDIKWIYDWFEMDSTSPRDVENEIEKANGEELEVLINSPGGDVFAGSEIYYLLKSYPGNVVTKIVGVAASAASVIAMGGKKVMMVPTAEMMIHNVSSVARGDYRDMEHNASVLKDFNSTIANAYMIKSGMEKDELLTMMNDETWLTPEKALEYNLIDEIMFMENIQLVASFGNSAIIPQVVIDKMRNEFGSNKLLKPLNKIQSELFNQEEEDIVDIKDLKEKHPELYNQILNEGVESERNRLKAIDDVAMPGFENLVNEAKYTSGISAENLAMEMIKASKGQGKSYLANANEDADQLASIEGVSTPQDNQSKSEKEDSVAKNIANAMNMRRRV